MVGDWVICTYPSINKPVKVIEIKTVSDEELKVVINYNGTCLVFRRIYIDPIPLTPEILEKNGFKKTTPDKYYPEPRYIWGIDSGRNGTIVTITIYEKPVHGVKVLTKIDTDCSHDCGINSIHNCDIEYVHQLQHALRLCGITKEIQI